MTFELIDSFLILLFLTVLVSWAFTRFRLPIIAGYIGLGVLVGPHIFNWIEVTPVTKEIAEFGVVFLLFTIGLEFSLGRLFSMSHIVFGFGGLQVLISIVTTLSIGTLLGMRLPETIVIAGIVATSSTAIVLKQLKEQKELNTSHGRNAIGILLFQDLAVIPFLVIIPTLSAEFILQPLAEALAKGILAAILILIIGRWIVRPLFYQIYEAKSAEVFMLATLLVAVGAAWISYKLDLPLVLGAFVAGVMLSETKFRNRLDLEMRPFRDLLLAFFFVSIGLQFNLAVVYQAWPWVLLLFSAIIFFKALLISLLGLFFSKDRQVAFRTGIILAQGSEFGFTILFLANRFHILPPEDAEVVLGALLLSIMASSVLIKYNGYISEKISAFAQHAFNQKERGGPQ